MFSVESFFVCVFLTILRIEMANAVKGCYTFIIDETLGRHSICDRMHTQFTEVPQDLPKEVVMLTINHQTISILDKKQLQNLPNLTYLNLDSNNLSVIEIDAFQSVPLLRTLSLRFNRLSLAVNSFHPGSLIRIRHLESLNLMQNPIGRVPAHFFYPVRKSLKFLVLAGAGDDFHPSLEAFEGLFQMETLDISYNKLVSLPEAFHGLLTTMSLKKLMLFGNPWMCDCSLRWLREWSVVHNSTQFYMDSRPPEGDSYLDNSGKVNYRPEPLSANNVVQPICAAPPQLAGRAIFPVPSLFNNPVSAYEMSCPPVPKTKNVHVRAKLGENITVACEFEATTVDEVSWSRNGSPLVPASRIRVRQPKVNQLFVDLFFHEFAYSDIGTYICMMKNGFGKANSTVMITLPDSTWLDEAQSDSNSPIAGWIDSFDTKIVLKYTSLVVIGLVLLLIAVGLFIYCFYGQQKKKTKPIHSQVSKSHSKESFSGLPLNKIHTDDSIDRYTNPSSYTMAPNRACMQPCVLSFQDSHPVYSIAGSDKNESEQSSCPVHGYSKATSALGTIDRHDACREIVTSHSHIAQLDETSFGIKLNVNLTPPMKNNDHSSPLVLLESIVTGTGDSLNGNSPPTDYVPCPKHGNILASFGTPTISHPDQHLSQILTTISGDDLSPTVLAYSPSGQRLQFASKPPRKHSSIGNTKKVEFLETAQISTGDEPGFITTV